MATNATQRAQAERSIDRSLDDVGHFLRHSWWAILLAALVVWLLVALVAPVVIAHWTIVGSALLAALEILVAVAFTALLCVALFRYMARPRVTWALPGDVLVSFKDYKGNPDVIEAAQRIVTLLRGAKGFKEMGGEISQGLLLVGPQGVGKSYLAQCISAEAGVPFAFTSALSFRPMFIGMDALMVKLLYRKARRLAREYGGCIIFIDEFDAIGMTRHGASNASAPTTQTGGAGSLTSQTGAGALNELLLHLDTAPLIEPWSMRALRAIGLARGAQREPVLTIASTAAPDALDSALMRPGRFDRKIVVSAPNEAHRAEVIEYYLAKAPHEDLPMVRLVADMAGYTPVAIKHVINEAMVLAHGEGRESITYADIANARETHEYGIRYPRSLSELEKRRLAYHEAGHVIAQAFLLPRYRVAHATIAKRLGSSGEAFVEAKPLEEIVTQSAEEIFASIEVALASRAAEELFLQTRLNGVGADLASATHLALQYVAHWGMGDTFFSAAATMAPERIYTDPMLRGQAERLLRQAYGEVRGLLERRRKAVIVIAEALLEREELASDEIEQLIRTSEVTALDQVAALSSMAEAALYSAPIAEPQPAAPQLVGPTTSTSARSSVDAAPTSASGTAGAFGSPSLGPVAFAASPSQELRADRVIDRAILHAPQRAPERQQTDPNLPTVSPTHKPKAHKPKR
ncbi:MAG TPA: AAA family ATPase [Ktedonobacterales bacterium]